MRLPLFPGLRRLPGRLLLAGVGAVLLAACHDAPVPSEPIQSAPVDSLRVVNGPAVCDACATIQFTIAGPDLAGIYAAAFVSRSTPPDSLSATIELRRFTGDSGVTLISRAAFTGPVAAGAYDLWLSTPGRNFPSQRLVIPGALRVVRGWRPPAPPTTPDDTSHGPGGGTPPPPPPPPVGVGTLRVVVNSSGADPDVGFSVSVDEDYGGPSKDVTTTAPAEFSLSAQTHVVSLYGVAPNCAVSGEAFRTVTVRADSTVTVTFSVTCTAVAYIRAELVLSGVDPFADPRLSNGGIPLRCDAGVSGCTSFSELRRSQLLRTVGGSHDLSLAAPYYCRTTPSDRAMVTAVSGDTVTVTFALTCDPFTGTVSVQVRGAGVGPSMSFGLLYGYPGCSSEYDCDFTRVAGGDTAAITAFTGILSVRLVDLPAFCQFAGPDEVQVAVAGGATTAVTFDVTCP